MKKSRMGTLALGLALAAALTAPVLGYDMPEEVYRRGTTPLEAVHQGPAPFVDVVGHWAEEDVNWTYHYGLTDSSGTGHYRPDEAMTRAEFAAMLGKLDGAEAEKYTRCPFDDVSAESPFAPYVTWAQQEGMLKGRTETKFDPDASISREELAVVLVRYLGGNLDARKNNTGFLDRGEVSEWAWESVSAAGAAGLLTGYPDGNFLPQRAVTRAEAAALIRRVAQCKFQEV